MSEETWIIAAYVVSALLESGGVLLVVWDLRDASAVLREMRDTSRLIEADPRHRLDPTYTRYGVAMPELVAAAHAARTGLGSIRRRVGAVCFLLAGIVLGGAANVTSVAR